METFLLIKVSIVNLPIIFMEQQKEILSRVHPLFQEHGAKTVTMDDVAQNCGISKKTLYQHFSNKEILLKQIIQYIHNEIQNIIQQILKLNYNPIQEQFELQNAIFKFIKSDQDIFMYEMMKYYPQLYDIHTSQMYVLVYETLGKNMKKGVEMGLYKSDLNYDWVIKLYFTSLKSIKSEDCFMENLQNPKDVNYFIMKFFLHSYVTDKGKSILQKQIIKNES